MSLGEIFSDAIKYHFSDITKFVIIGIISLLASLTGVFSSFGMDGVAVQGIAVSIALIFSLILSGYALRVIKKGIEYSDDIPEIDFKTNLIDGIKALIINIVYFIIPAIIAFLLLGASALIGAGINHMVASMGLSVIVVIILFLIFAIFEMVAMARFADTGDMGAALSIGSVFEDVKRIGVVNIILFEIVALIIIIVALVIASAVSLIPYIGVIIATIVLGAFFVLFYYKALGLLYAGA